AMKRSLTAGGLDWLSPSRRAMSRAFAQIDTQTWGALAVSAQLFETVDAVEILQGESGALLADPATWLDQMEEASEAGDERATSSLLLVKYLFGCCLLLVRRLDPTARTLERYGSVLAAMVLLTVVLGTVNAHDPERLRGWKEYLASPAGIVTVLFGALTVAADGMPGRRKHKPSIHRRGGSRPRKRVLERRLHR
ncbi:hypothetical protein, partial [Micromonospora sp. SL4-19]|uniref:hypothetical protein n=1 Tax=Micromonospora sp. SL4-19 TaxID=3399129 RepID=UPI003A4D2487